MSTAWNPASSRGGSSGGVRFASMQFTEPATDTYPITAAAPDPVNTFTVAGDHAAQFSAAGASFAVSGSTGNDGTYTVASAVFGAATVITVNETVADATADGNILIAAVPTLAATLPVAAGERVIDVTVIAASAGTWTENCQIVIGDTAQPTGYANVDINSILIKSGPYDPTTASGACGIGSQNFNSTYAFPDFYSSPAGSSLAGAGVPYATDDTITATLSGIVQGGGGGSFLVYVMIQAAVTPVVAA